MILNKLASYKTICELVEERDCYLAQAEVEGYYLTRERGLTSSGENQTAETGDEIT